MDLDQLLDASAPTVVARTPELQCELNDLVAACEDVHSSRRRTTRVALVGAVAASVLSVGAAASAAGLVPGWPSFSTASGQVCTIEVVATPLAQGDGQAVSPSFTPAEREEALAAAQDFLGGFDFDAVDRDEAIAWWKNEEARARSLQSDPSERAPRLTGDDLEVTAVSHWVVARLRSHLAAHSLDVRAIDLVTSSSGCLL